MASSALLCLALSLAFSTSALLRSSKCRCPPTAEAAATAVEDGVPVRACARPPADSPGRVRGRRQRVLGRPGRYRGGGSASVRRNGGGPPHHPAQRPPPAFLPQCNWDLLCHPRLVYKSSIYKHNFFNLFYYGAYFICILRKIFDTNYLF